MTNFHVVSGNQVSVPRTICPLILNLNFFCKKIELSSIILRWRSHRYVLTSDIEKMFRMIIVALKDRKYQSIFWRDDFTNEIQAYELNTVTYGTACAPYLANRVIKQLVLDHGKHFLLAAPILEHDTYVDDILFGAEDVILAKKMRDQLLQLTATGGIPLRKWSSNNPKLLSDLPQDEHNLVLKIPFEENVNLQVLAICWDPQTDCFKFDVQTLTPGPNTKRTILSSIAR